MEKAGSFDIDKIKKACPILSLKLLRRLRKNPPQPPPVVKKTRIGLAQPDGQYKVVYETKELMEPNPFPPVINRSFGCRSRSAPDFFRFLITIGGVVYVR